LYWLASLNHFSALAERRSDHRAKSIKVAQSTGPLADDRLYSTFRGQQMNDHVNPVFSDILAAVAPPKEIPAYQAESERLIEEAADILCTTDTQRALLQNIYSLGKQDGFIEATKDALKRLRA